MSLTLRPHLEESLILTLYDLVNHLTKNGENLALIGDLTVQQWLVLLQIAGDPNFPSSASKEGSPETVFRSLTLRTYDSRLTRSAAEIRSPLLLRI